MNASFPSTLTHNTHIYIYKHTLILFHPHDNFHDAAPVFATAVRANNQPVLIIKTKVDYKHAFSSYLWQSNQYDAVSKLHSLHL